MKGRNGAGFGSPQIHSLMLADHTRTDAYMRALKAAIRPGDVVLDIGTGSGVLAASAAQLGARRVYAVEAGPAAEQARLLIARNQLSSQVEVLRGWSHKIELPEKVDLVVSETLGNQPFAEGILASLADAQRRWTRPGARFIPASVELVAFIVQIPISQGAHFSPADYGLDLQTLSEWQAGEGVRSEYHPPQRVKSWRFLSEGLSLAWARPPWDAISDGTSEFQVLSPGRIDAIVFAFRAHLGEGVTLSTCPQEASADCHWTNQVCVMPRAPLAAPGEAWSLSWDLRPNSRVPAMVHRMN